MDIGSARNAVAVTPHDTNSITTARALYVGVGGDITLRTRDDGVDVLFKAVPSGVILPVVTKYVRATGTTATNILALY